MRPERVSVQLFAAALFVEKALACPPLTTKKLLAGLGGDGGGGR